MCQRRSALTSVIAAQFTEPLAGAAAGVAGCRFWQVGRVEWAPRPPDDASGDKLLVAVVGRRDDPGDDLAAVSYFNRLAGADQRQHPCRALAEFPHPNAMKVGVGFRCHV